METNVICQTYLTGEKKSRKEKEKEAFFSSMEKFESLSIYSRKEKRMVSVHDLK